MAFSIRFGSFAAQTCTSCPLSASCASSCRRLAEMKGRLTRARASSRAEETQRREYHRWSPAGEMGATNDTLLNFEGEAGPRHQPEQPPAKPKPQSKSPQAVAMEEFSALERKLSPSGVEPMRRTPEQVAMEEFAALERKLGSTATVTTAAAGAYQSYQSLGSSGLSKAPSKRPEEPAAEECCGNGCSTCVWIGYWEELQAWEEAGREREEAPP